MIIRFEGRELTTIIDENGVCWWIAKDVCEMLGLTQVSRATRSIPVDQKGVTTCNTPGGAQKVTTVNEKGLYRLIFKSEKPEAQRFQDFIYGEVLPSIHRYGCWPPPSEIASPSDPFLAMLDGVKTLYVQQQELAQRQNYVENRIDRLEQEHEEARSRAMALPAPEVEPRQLTTRELCRQAVDELVRLTGVGHQETWRKVYYEYSYQAGINLTVRSEKKKIGKLDWVEKYGDLDLLYGIVKRMASKAA